MRLTKKDLSILDKFNFQVPVVGVNFLVKKPEKINRLKGKMAFCEMLKLAQEGSVFYSGLDNHDCGGGKHVIGGEVEPAYTTGQFGAGLNVFCDAPTASNIYQYLPTIEKGKVNYVSFGPLSKLDVAPDVVVIVADAEQAEIILRASTYRTGKIWDSKWSAVIGCAWLMVYPYLTGKINHHATGFGHGMKRKKIFPPNMHVIAIPSNLLPEILEVLQEMPWVLPAFKPDGSEYVRKLCVKLGIIPRG
jgi:uncharacterized protein (DUF169 family)